MKDWNRLAFNHRTRDRRGGHAPHQLPSTWSYWGPAGCRFNKRQRTRTLRSHQKVDTRNRIREHFIDIELDYAEWWLDEEWYDDSPMDWDDHDGDWDDDPYPEEHWDDYYDRTSEWDYDPYDSFYDPYY